MKLPRQTVLWLAAAAVSVVLLGSVLVIEYGHVQRRYAPQVTARPEAGRVVFSDKGCAACHGVTAGGTEFAPALRQRASLSSLPRLVTAMWNHAPRMWAAIETQNLSYPNLSDEETAQLIAYLYISGCADHNGDPQRGRELFVSKQCVRCHGPEARDPRLARAAGSTPLAWTQSLWNHAAGMSARMRQAGVQWPKFQPSEVRDLFAYVYRQNGGNGEFPMPTGDPETGWRLFQQRQCIRCHSVTSDGQGAHLGADRPLPPTFSEFGAAMLNHIPQMQRATQSESLAWPEFQGNDMSDIAVFVYSLHYLEPSGSPQVGRTVFAARCGTCHGDAAQGASGPALRGRGKNYTSVRLAAELWRHGGRMYERTRSTGEPWPQLQESDIGNLLSFLNTPLDK